MINRTHFNFLANTEELHKHTTNSRQLIGCFEQLKIYFANLEIMLQHLSLVCCHFACCGQFWPLIGIK